MCSVLLGHHANMLTSSCIRCVSSYRAETDGNENYKNWVFKCHQGRKYFNQPIRGKTRSLEEQSRTAVFLLAGRGDGGGGGGAFSHFLLVIQSVRSSQSSKYIWSSRLCVFRQSTIVPSRGKGFWIRFVFNFPKTHIKFVFLIHLFIYLF